MNKGAFLTGLGVWSFLEYATHRFLLHGPLLRLHLPHHQRPHAETFDWKPSIIGGILADMWFTAIFTLACIKESSLAG